MLWGELPDALLCQVWGVVVDGGEPLQPEESKVCMVKKSSPGSSRKNHGIVILGGMAGGRDSLELQCLKILFSVMRFAQGRAGGDFPLTFSHAIPSFPGMQLTAILMSLLHQLNV